MTLFGSYVRFLNTKGSLRRSVNLWEQGSSRFEVSDSLSREMLRIALWLLGLGLHPVWLVSGLRVGIVGGGQGGCSAAQLLSRAPGVSSVEVWEASDVLGGRLRVVELGGRSYEAGGSVIHPDNRLMLHYAELGGLAKRQSPDVPGAETVLFDGAKTLIAFQEDDSVLAGLTTLYRTFVRYGWDLLHLKWNIDGVLARFAGIYDALGEGEAFEDAEGLLGRMSEDFPALLSETLEHYLLSEVGLGRRAVDEVARVAVHVNNAQLPSRVQAFVGAVALAGMDPDLWSVEGGNFRVPEALCRRSGAAVHMGANVTRVRRLGSGEWEVEVGGTAKATYDALIVAAPFRRGQGNMAVEGADEGAVEAVTGTYHRMFATFVEGSPRWTKWGYPDGGPDRDVLVTNPALPYISLGRLSPVDWRPGQPVAQGARRVWKLFSQTPVSAPLLADMFVEMRETKSVEWLAYPDYAEESRPQRMDFRLGKGLYYANAVEWTASAMEMASLGALNAVNLLLKDHSLPPLSPEKPQEKMEL